MMKAIIALRERQEKILTEILISDEKNIWGVDLTVGETSAILTSSREDNGLRVIS